MLKNHYKKELNIKNLLRKGSRGKGVKKAQEWLNLWKYYDPKWRYACGIDGIFGPNTEKTVRGFQEFKGLEVDGIVGPVTFQALTWPMRLAFAPLHKSDLALHELIVAYANMHLTSVARELNQRNEGPWVRAYMDGHEGRPWAWCMGFVQTVYDQAFGALDKKFTAFMPHTYSCDVVGHHVLQNGSLIRKKDLPGRIGEVKPGSIFLIVKTPYDWTHTGIITGVDGDCFHTIEGNTNDEGVREGFEVCQRIRDFKQGKVDVVVLDEK